jgi:hypothetical protein
VVTIEAQEWLGPSETARALDLSVSRVRQLALNGDLRYVSTSLGKLFAADDVARLAAVRRAGSGNSATENAEPTNVSRQ